MCVWVEFIWLLDGYCEGKGGGFDLILEGGVGWIIGWVLVRVVLGSKFVRGGLVRGEGGDWGDGYWVESKGGLMKNVGVGGGYNMIWGRGSVVLLVCLGRR
jgi:hypothetical protein